MIVLFVTSDAEKKHYLHEYIEVSVSLLQRIFH